MITETGYCDFCNEYRQLDKAKRERHGYYCPTCSRGLIYLAKEDYTFTLTQDAQNEFGRNSWAFEDEGNARTILKVFESLILNKGKGGLERGEHGRSR